MSASTAARAAHRTVRRSTIPVARPPLPSPAARRVPVTVVVALPSGTAAGDAVRAAARIATRAGYTAHATIDHFTARPPRAVRALHHDLVAAALLGAVVAVFGAVLPTSVWSDPGWITAAGGGLVAAVALLVAYRRGDRPVRRLGEFRRRQVATGRVGDLDLALMRRAARRAADCRWLGWQAAVADTEIAEALWSFRERTAADPQNWPPARAERAYREQPRIRAMDLAGADPDRGVELDRVEVEMFQAGRSAYTNYRGLAAVPAAALIDASAGAPTLARRPDGAFGEVIDYLVDAHQVLRDLDGDAVLVALACTGGGADPHRRAAS